MKNIIFILAILFSGAIVIADVDYVKDAGGIKKQESVTTGQLNEDLQSLKRDEASLLGSAELYQGYVDRYQAKLNAIQVQITDNRAMQAKIQAVLK